MFHPSIFFSGNPATFSGTFPADYGDFAFGQDDLGFVLSGFDVNNNGDFAQITGSTTYCVQQGIPVSTTFLIDNFLPPQSFHFVGSSTTFTIDGGDEESVGGAMLVSWQATTDDPNGPANWTTVLSCGPYVEPNTPYDGCGLDLTVSTPITQTTHYRRVATTLDFTRFESNVITAYVNPGNTITNNFLSGSNVVLEYGDTHTIVGATPNGGGTYHSYQWERSGDGINFYPIAARGKDYIPPPTKGTMFYRRKVTSVSPASVSNAVRVNTYEPGQSPYTSLFVNVPTCNTLSNQQSLRRPFVHSDDPFQRKVYYRFFLSSALSGSKKLHIRSCADFSNNVTLYRDGNEVSPYSTGTTFSGCTASATTRSYENLAAGVYIVIAERNDDVIVPDGDITTFFRIDSQGGKTICSGGPLPSSARQEGISIYPNPAHGMLYLETTPDLPSAGGQLFIYDTKGRIVAERLFNFELSNKLEVDISNLPAGLYMVKTVTPEETFSQKISVQ